MKAAKGNPGRRKIGSDPVEAGGAVASSITHPTWLKGPGLKIWKKIAPRLVALKLLTQTDADTFARYCRNYARWLSMQTRLDDMGEIYEIETASGTVRRADPAYMIADRLERQLVSAESVFGLNPAERQRIFAARAAKTPGADDLFRGQTMPAAPASPTQPSVPASTHGKTIGFLQ
ncbi:phage terminase small subunit P27 family [Hoeflea sp. YIM 152468]|uniref:phage terminase small subunit P27 family n=1 Tax=Hoeflea sp. YIM 152468 TaxID=3031759 RepID=UPI0023DC5620|nr:phage terminase small subunit P27 family [Hoeflea sp. YIM 152468]MDF1606965.1 phage terminase small subunit P27 family [Hoeflea sp. YIM 152468]